MGEPTRVTFPTGVNTLPRIRTCLRCERVADLSRERGWPVPPIAQVHSWIAGGIRYWAGLCLECSDLEKRERDAKTRHPDARGAA